MEKKYEWEKYEVVRQPRMSRGFFLSKYTSVFAHIGVPPIFIYMKPVPIYYCFDNICL